MRTRQEILNSLENTKGNSTRFNLGTGEATPLLSEEGAILEILLDIRDLLDFRSRGGKKRATNLSKKRLKEIATKASHARKVYKDKQK